MRSKYSTNSTDGTRYRRARTSLQPCGEPKGVCAPSMQKLVCIDRQCITEPTQFGYWRKPTVSLWLFSGLMCWQTRNGRERRMDGRNTGGMGKKGRTDKTYGEMNEWTRCKIMHTTNFCKIVLSILFLGLYAYSCTKMSFEPLGRTEDCFWY